MKKFLIILLISLASLSCERRELDHDYFGSIDVLVQPDWSELPNGVEMPQYLKAYFYPTHGGKAIERYIDPEGEIVQVPPGEYNVILYTWRINSDAQSVQFRGCDCFETIEGYTAQMVRSSVNRVEPTSPIILQPDDYMYSWSSSNSSIAITKSAMQSQSTSKGDTKKVVVIDALMQNRVKHYKVCILIENNSSAATIDAYVTGATGWYRLADGALSDKHYSVNIEPAIVQTKSSGNGSAVVDFSFNSFGLLLDKSEDIVELIITTVNGDGIRQAFVLDLTADMIAIEQGKKEEVTPADHPAIVIEPSKPPEGGGFSPPTVGD